MAKNFSAPVLYKAAVGAMLAWRSTLAWKSPGGRSGTLGLDRFQKEWPAPRSLLPRPGSDSSLKGCYSLRSPFGPHGTSCVTRYAPFLQRLLSRFYGSVEPVFAGRAMIVLLNLSRVAACRCIQYQCGAMSLCAQRKKSYSSRVSPPG